MMRIRRIRLFSAAKIVGFLYAIMGFLSGVALINTLPLLLSSNPQLPGEVWGQPTAVVVGLGSLVVLPLVYWILGAIIGLLMALIYNLAAGWFGGLEIEYE